MVVGEGFFAIVCGVVGGLSCGFSGRVSLFVYLSPPSALFMSGNMNIYI